MSIHSYMRGTIEGLSVRLLVLCCTFGLACEISLAGPAPLTADEVRTLVTGNTLVFQHDTIAGDLRYFSPDGTTMHDPERGFVTLGRWTIGEHDAKLCIRETQDKLPYCGHITRNQDTYLVDWGIDRVPAYSIRVEPGNLTNHENNPGKNYGPRERLSLPAAVRITPPAKDLPAPVAALSGSWFGTWYVFRDFALIVERIDHTSADIVYSWGQNFFRKDEPGWIRTHGRIEHKTLHFAFGAYQVSAMVDDDGLLKLEIEHTEFAGLQRALPWSIPSSDLLSPVANIDISPPMERRTKLLIPELQSGLDIGDAPIHNGHFMPVGDHAPAQHRFEGRLTIGASKALRRRAGGRDSYNVRFPPFSAEFVTIGEQLVPAARGIITPPRGTSAWNIILGPGRTWSEPGDQGWSRASFPFTLTRPLRGLALNGIASFAFTSSEISEMNFQVVQETSPNNQIDMWGTASARYEPGTVDGRDHLVTDFAQELKDQIQFHPWSKLVELHGSELMDIFDGTEIRPNVSQSGLVIDGKAYATGCRTRYGPYPYCRHMRHGVYSVTKSIGAGLTLFRLAQKYGAEVFDLKITDYVDLNADHDGWLDVTFGDTLNMVTGIGNMYPRRVTHFVETDSSAVAIGVYGALSVRAKLEAAGRAARHPWKPAEVFRYRSIDTFVLSAAMDAYLKSVEGPDAQLWSMMQREVFNPIGIQNLPTLHTVEPDGAHGVPVYGWGLFATLEDVIKVARLLRNGGRHGGIQILHAETVAAVMNGKRKGWPTGWQVQHGEAYYKNSFWIGPHRSRSGCTAQIPSMSGYGGSYVLLMPNGMTAIRFADGPIEGDSRTTYNSFHMRHVADTIRPLC